MNKLFELFIFGLISSRIKESLIGKYKETIVITANEGDSKKEGDPDILVGKGNGRWSVVIDAKYKREVKNMDLYQIWTYAIALGL
jgi:5-methylcytosine-specific restriction endonuclease McrBC regulatory subunit McrC